MKEFPVSVWNLCSIHGLLYFVSLEEIQLASMAVTRDERNSDFRLPKLLIFRCFLGFRLPTSEKCEKRPEVFGSLRWTLNKLHISRISSH
ncbi:hypothetical protein Y032_0014g2274 [Ancylostoma ceylanicum]|uniref:Uncharacterized protein n=1 Tax=Ancylostoma ceylanicum TaxID=53326 RepID=A0A016V8Q5_9BILA|nr:hypothetical protein Y032_0014g2274 [Ancylostoma ceylanicum]